MSELMDFIREFVPEEGTLPLIHTTDKFTLQLIRDSKKLEVTDDNAYPGEQLLYLFYGRPSYRINSSVNHTTASFFAPICLIFDRDLLSRACRIMPFDSGAHAAGSLDATIHKKMKRGNFELEVSSDAPMKLIKCFYGNEAAYLQNEPQASSIDVGDVQRKQQHYVEAYYHLVNYRSNSELDERVNAIEVQFDKDIPIEGNLKAVIVPSRYFDSEMIEKIELELGATAIMYDMPASYKPTEIMNTIYEKVRQFVLASHEND